MGCLGSKEKSDTEAKTEPDKWKVFRRWSYQALGDGKKWKRPTKDEYLSRFDGDREKMLEFLNVKGLTYETKVFQPGDIDEYDITIEGCVGCDIYILDITAQVQIDECTDCRFFIAPCTGSIFIRNCKNIRLASASAQLRFRDCSQVVAMVFVRKASVVESCKQISFACWNVGYFQLANQLSRTGLSVFENGWMCYNDFGTQARCSFLAAGTTVGEVMAIKRPPPPDDRDDTWRTLSDIAPQLAEATAAGPELCPIPVTTRNRDAARRAFLLFSPLSADAALTVASVFSADKDARGFEVSETREFGPVPDIRGKGLLSGIPALEKGGKRADLMAKGPLIGLLLGCSDASADLLVEVKAALNGAALCILDSAGGAQNTDAELTKGQVCVWADKADNAMATARATTFFDELRGELDG